MFCSVSHFSIFSLIFFISLFFPGDTFWYQYLDNKLFFSDAWPLKKLWFFGTGNFFSLFFQTVLWDTAFNPQGPRGVQKVIKIRVTRIGIRTGHWCWYLVTPGFRDHPFKNRVISGGSLHEFVPSFSRFFSIVTGMF